MQRQDKRRNVTRGAALVAIAGLAVTSAGCLGLIAVGAAGGAAGFIYMKGKVCMDYPTPFADAWTASHQALKSLGLPVLGEENAGTRGSINSRTADGTKITIDVEPQTSRLPNVQNLTRVCVRVGMWGDRTLSEQILATVTQQLVPSRLTPQPAGAVSSAPPTWTPSGAPPSGIQPVGNFQAGETAPPPLLPGGAR